MASDTNDRFPVDADNSPGGVLAKLFRKIMQEAGLMSAYDVLVDRYVHKTSMHNVSAVERKTKSTLKANLTSSSMTFKTFTDLIFVFIGAKRMDITIKLTYPNDDVSVHNLSVKSNILFETKQEEESKDAKE